MEKISIKKIKSMFENISGIIIANEPELTEIDRLTGDGDHGYGMKQGFSAVKNVLETRDFKSIQKLFMTAGMTLIDVMGGASGVLFGTLFISGVSQIKNEEFITLDEFAASFDMSVKSIMDRGGAKAGDKTMVDALLPAVNALTQAAAGGKSFSSAAELAYLAAKKGAEDTKAMLAKRGRSATFKEKSIGQYDAGAISVTYIFKGIYETFKGEI